MLILTSEVSKLDEEVPRVSSTPAGSVLSKSKNKQLCGVDKSVSGGNHG